MDEWDKKHIKDPEYVAFYAKDIFTYLKSIEVLFSFLNLFFALVKEHGQIWVYERPKRH